MVQQQVKVRKKELEQSLVLEQNPLKSMIQDMERDLELNHDFFLGDNVVCKSKDIIIPIKNIKIAVVGRKITVQQKLNHKIYLGTFLGIFWGVLISIMRRLLSIVLLTSWSTWIRFLWRENDRKFPESNRWYVKTEIISFEMNFIFIFAEMTILLH